MRYIKWLHVYAKDFTKLTPRMSKLVNDYEVSISSHNIHTIKDKALKKPLLFLDKAKVRGVYRNSMVP